MGISYKTQSIAGVTGATGTFRFVPGETVTFSVGDITLPFAPATAVVTPLELVGTDNVNNQSVTNILRFLQTLDEDGNPDNGIVIDAAAVTAATGETLNFSAATAVFEDAFEDIFGTTLIPVDQAVAHFLRQVIPLAGDWRASILTAGFNSSSLMPYEDSYWEKVDLDIALDGSFAADSVESGGDTDTGNGQFNLTLLDETGQLTLNGAADWFGAIDAGKTVFGFVDIDDDVGPTLGCCGGEQLGIAVRRSDIIGYDQSDLAGNWRIFELHVSEDGTENHSRRPIGTVANNGVFSYTAIDTDSSGVESTNGTESGSFTLSHDGTLTTTGLDFFEGVLDAGKTVMNFVVTDGDDDTIAAAVGVKQGSGYETSDLRGIWRSFLVTVAEDGTENYQDRGSICIQNDGVYKVTFIESGGDTGTDTGTFAINATTGVLSVSGSSTFNGALDAGKTVAGFVDFDDDVNGLQVGVLIKTNFLPVTFSCP
ncbi:MAG: hypothetical protein ACRES4_02915 [Nevskiales bacterium]